MAEEVSIRKGKPFGRYGQFIHGGNAVQDARKVIFLIPQEKWLQF